MKTFDDRDESYLVLTAAAFFSLDPGASLLSEISMWKLAAEELGKDAALDACMPKPRGEVLIAGRAYPQGQARTACSVSVKLGSIDKTLYVVGERRWKLGAPTEPEPFTEMVISYENAFGGPGYPQNPVGKGSAPTKSGAGELHVLPNIEDPKHILKSPNERPPLPSGFGPYDLTWPQRYSKIGTYDDRWFKERYPGYAGDLDRGFFNTAPPDQQIEGFFRGDEPFTLENMHAEKALIESKLPGIRARLFVNQDPGGVSLREVPMRAETVHLFPHVERGILLFRGLVKVAEDDAGDVRHVLAAFEALDDPKPIAHYELVLFQRLDRKKGHLYALRDRDLLPASAAKTGAAVPGDDMDELLATEGLFGKNIDRRAALLIDRIREKLEAAGVDPGERMQLPPRPEREEVPDLDSLPEFVEKKEAQLAFHVADVDRQVAASMDEARKECAKHGVDFDVHVEKQKKSGGGPPKFSADAELQKLRDQLELATRGGVRLAHVEAQLADPKLEEKLRTAERALFEMYRRFAHYQPAASALESDRAAALRDQVVAEREAGASFAERDLTGIDLSSVDLQGADFSGAFLECANLSGADLRGADLRRAVLVRADLRGAKLEGAKLAGANAGEANLERADLSGGVDATGAVLTKTRLAHADFTGADLTGADLGGALFDSTNFTGVKAKDLRFLKSDLSGLRLVGADLEACFFIETTLAGVDFTNANLSRGAFVTVKGDGAIFRGATLEKAVFVEECSFEKADFTDANMPGVLLRNAKLKGSDFTRARLSGADFSGADLTDAKLGRVSAVGALFIRTNLTRADVRRADLMDAILQKATLHGTNLEKANLFRADLMKVDVDGATNTKGANMKKIRFLEARKPHG